MFLSLLFGCNIGYIDHHTFVFDMLARWNRVDHEIRMNVKLLSLANFNIIYQQIG